MSVRERNAKTSRLVSGRDANSSIVGWNEKRQPIEDLVAFKRVLMSVLQIMRAGRGIFNPCSANFVRWSGPQNSPWRTIGEWTANRFPAMIFGKKYLLIFAEKLFAFSGLRTASAHLAQVLSGHVKTDAYVYPKVLMGFCSVALEPLRPADMCLHALKHLKPLLVGSDHLEFLRFRFP